jgi:hypothetical protein
VSDTLAFHVGGVVICKFHHIIVTTRVYIGDSGVWKVVFVEARNGPGRGLGTGLVSLVGGLAFSNNI